VTIDETRYDRRARRVDRVDVRAVRRAAVRSEIRDAVAADEKRDPRAKRRRAAVRERRAAQQGRRYLAFLPIVRMKVSMGIALSVSIWTVPRAPSPTETRATVSTSFASTMFTKS